MRIFHNRPLAMLCVSLAVIFLLSSLVLTAYRLAFFMIFAVLGIISLIFALKFARLSRIFWYGVALFMGAALAFFSTYLYFDLYLEPLQSQEGETMTVSGVVIERASSTSFAATLRVRLDTVDGTETDESVILDCEYPTALQMGDRFEAVVTQRAFELVGSYDEEIQCLSDGYTRVLVCASAEDCRILEREDNWQTTLLRWNHTLSETLYQEIGEEYGGLAVALLLGNRSYLSDRLLLDFSRAGISHLLALSGLHVSVLILFLELVLRFASVPKVGRALIVPIVMLAYTLLTGGSPSILRAVLMTCFLYIAYLLRANYDPLTALSVILSLILLLSPYAVYDLSLWLSFVAASAIIVFSPSARSLSDRIRGKGKRRAPWRRFLGALLDVLAIGVIANAAVLPIVAWTFGETSVLSVPATVFLTPMMSVLLVFSLLSLCVPILPLRSWLCNVISALTVLLTQWLSGISGVLLSMTGTLDTVLLVLLSCLMIVLAVIKTRAWIPFSAIALSACVLLISAHIATVTMSYEYTKASEESGGFSIVSEGGRLLAVDRSAQSAGEIRLLLDEAGSRRCTELDELILPAYDERSPYLIEYLADFLKIRRIRICEPTDEAERALLLRIEEFANRRGIELRFDLDEPSVLIPIEERLTLGDPYVGVH